MKKRLLGLASVLVTAIFLTPSSPLPAQPADVSVVNVTIDPGPDFSTLNQLVTNQLPDCYFRTTAGCSANFYSLVNSGGNSVSVLAAHPEMPQPVTNAIGYWDSPIMNFLARQKIKTATADDAIHSVQLYLSLWQGTDYTRQKLCHARRFDDRWVVEVEHDFTNFPGQILAITPFELQVNVDSRIIQFRERCYDYLGSAAVYTNTLTTAYQREVKIRNGLGYPEAADRELRAAWKNEQEQLLNSPPPQNH
jgi:hypothetical protein